MDLNGKVLWSNNGTGTLLWLVLFCLEAGGDDQLNDAGISQSAVNLQNKLDSLRQESLFYAKQR
jgi:hypothetical protein